MHNPLIRLLDAWLRRYWTADAVALSGLREGRPAVVITGGSEGIGLAIAERFAADRATLVLIARNADTLAAAATDLACRHSVDVCPLALDISADDAGERIASFLTGAGLYADVLVNNAGIGLSGPFAEQDPTAITSLIDLNVRALTLLTRRFLPDMCVRGHGGVLNIASLGGYGPGPNQAAYYASKAYVISLTRAVAYEVRGKGVRITVVSPGPVDTRFHEKMGADTALYRYLIKGMSAEQIARAAWRGYRWGLKVVLPGLMTPLLALAMTLSPGILSLPIIGFLLQRPGSKGKDRGDARRY